MPLAFEQHCFNVDAIWSGPYDNSTISSVNQYGASLSFFRSFTILSFLLLFFLICLFLKFVKESFFMNIQGIKVNPKFLLFSERERERERDRQTHTHTERARETESEKEHHRSPVVSRVVRWCWVNFQCRGVTLILDSRKRGLLRLQLMRVVVVWTFFVSSIFSLFFLPLWETARY